MPNKDKYRKRSDAPALESCFKSFATVLRTKVMRTGSINSKDNGDSKI